MTASPETIAEKLASIIDEKGPSALTDDPYGVYQKILSEKTADRRTAGALLHVLVSSVPVLAQKNQDAEELSAAVKKECCLTKAMADRMAEVFSLLYSEENRDGWKKMDRDGLREFLAGEFMTRWEGEADWERDGGSVHCTFNADIVLKPLEKASEDRELLELLKKNPFMPADDIHSYFEKKLLEYLDSEFDDYCSDDDYYPPVAEDFGVDYYLAKWCKSCGFEVVSCDGSGDTSDFEYEGRYGRY